MCDTGVDCSLVFVAKRVWCYSCSVKQGGWLAEDSSSNRRGV